MLARLVIGPSESSRPVSIAAATAGPDPRRPSGTNGVSQMTFATLITSEQTAIQESMAAVTGTAGAAGGW